MTCGEEHNKTFELCTLGRKPYDRFYDRFSQVDETNHSKTIYSLLSIILPESTGMKGCYFDISFQNESCEDRLYITNTGEMRSKFNKWTIRKHEEPNGYKVISKIKYTGKIQSIKRFKF